MKKAWMILAAVAMVALTACQQTKKSETDNVKHVGVAYFSATGTTEAVAELLAQAAEADLIAIEAEVPYTDADLDWHDSLSRSSVEMRDPAARPAMKAIEQDLSQYDTLYLGFPIWWGVAPRIINTFMETAAVQGKVLIPFATSGTNEIDEAQEALALAYPDVQWLPGRRLNDANFDDLCAWTKGAKE